jgi:2-(1,2-epoxy-1,2-dihydrophenyl)acetyl-CoA isomerase
MMSESSLLIELNHSVLTLTLNRSPVNALNLDLIAALQEAFKQAERDGEVRCVVLTGSGSAFSAGQDIGDFAQNEDIPIRYHLLRTYNPLIVQIRRLEKPVLASLNGMVSGAALGLALACDLRIAAHPARFVVGFGGIGLAPDSAVSLLLPILIGLGRATEAAFSNAPITARQALEWGMVNRVVAADDLAAPTPARAGKLAEGPLRTFGLTKRAFNKAVLGNLEQVLDYEAHIQEIAGKTAEHKEGVRAFLEKRPPKFHQETP